MSSRNNSKSKNSKSKSKNSKSKFSNSKKDNSKKDNSKKDKFDDSPSASYESIIDLLSVSISATDKDSVTWKDQFNDYIILVLKYLFLVTLFTLNFLGLSVSLNCNADNEFFQRIMSAIFAFFFGFVYLIVNYYTYKVLSQGKICKMDRDKLFPFKS